MTREFSFTHGETIYTATLWNKVEGKERYYIKRVDGTDFACFHLATSELVKTKGAWSYPGARQEFLTSFEAGREQAGADVREIEELEQIGAMMDEAARVATAPVTPPVAVEFDEHHDLETGLTVYTLAQRLSGEDWKRVAHLFERDVELDCPSYNAWNDSVTLPWATSRPDLVQAALGVPTEARMKTTPEDFQAQREQAQRVREQIAAQEAEAKRQREAVAARKAEEAAKYFEAHVAGLASVEARMIDLDFSHRYEQAAALWKRFEGEVDGRQMVVFRTEVPRGYTTIEQYWAAPETLAWLLRRRWEASAKVNGATKMARIALSSENSGWERLLEIEGVERYVELAKQDTWFIEPQGALAVQQREAAEQYGIPFVMLEFEQLTPEQDREISCACILKGIVHEGVGYQRFDHLGTIYRGNDGARYKFDSSRGYVLVPELTEADLAEARATLRSEKARLEADCRAAEAKRAARA